VDSLYTLYLSVARTTTLDLQTIHKSLVVQSLRNLLCGTLPLTEATRHLLSINFPNTSAWPEHNTQNLLFLWNSPYDSAHAHYIQDYDFQVMHKKLKNSMGIFRTPLSLWLLLFLLNVNDVSSPKTQFSYFIFDKHKPFKFYTILYNVLSQDIIIEEPFLFCLVAFFFFHDTPILSKRTANEF